MKYKLLKEIDTDSLPIGTTFETDNDYVNVDNGMKIPCKLLIDQGFIEEVKETPKPRWKVGDCVAINVGDGNITYTKINQILIYNVDGIKMYYINDQYNEEDLRDPTPEELSTYFR